MPIPDSDRFEISPVEAAAWLAEPESKPVLIDCREEEEWAVCHLEGALLVPLSRFVEAAPTVIPCDQPLMVYCHHGVRSLRATRWLRQQGWAAWSLAGGIDRWAEEIDPSLPRY